MKPSGKYSAFISYASETREKAEQICASLEARGLVCWIAPRDVRAGREYADEIIQGLERSAAVVLVLSQAANTSVFVLREIERAIAKEINVVPVRIEEVTPSPGLELFISGTHWLDVWRGNWDDHMDRLVRDLDETTAVPRPAATFGARRSAGRSPSLRNVYIGAGLALALALSGVAIWWFPRDTPGPDAAPVSGDVETPDRSGGDQGPSIVTGGTTTIARVPDGRVASTQPNDTVPPGERPTVVASAAPSVRETGARTSQVAPPAPSRSEAPPRVDTSGELGALTEDYDNLSLRAGVVDDTLNQLWEEMKPNAPRLDMVTHQRRLRTNLTRIKAALADKDVAGARRYLASGREDLEALERFLNR